MYFETPDPAPQGLLSNDMLTDYIAYARKNCHPEILDSARDRLVEGYV
jgi:DNA replicative helicase MCM subunit Mcm2 (Cdc46/Mcm family)